jgi:hypothetical protein
MDWSNILAAIGAALAVCIVLAIGAWVDRGREQP